MPTRKQRRRNAKGRRHEYEYVYVDQDGNEVEADEDDAPDAKPARAKPTKATATPGKKPGTAQRSRQAPGARNARKIDPPSWQRVFRRAAVFAPVMLLVIYFLKPKNASPASLILQLVVLLCLFLPFSYYMDTLMYRNYRKRIGDPIPPRERKPRSG